MSISEPGVKKRFETEILRFENLKKEHLRLKITTHIFELKKVLDIYIYIF